MWFLLGNELCAEGISARVDSVEYAKDITRLRHIVNLLYPIASTRPKVLGPGGFYGKEWFSSFLMNVGPGVVDGITHHIYNLGAGMSWFSSLALSNSNIYSLVIGF